MKKRWSLLSVVLCSSLIISACGPKEIEEVTAREAISVAVAKATNESLDAMSSVSGTLQAYRTVEVAFEVGGIVDQVNVAVGDSVAAGTVLSNLDDADFARQVELAGKSVEQAQVSIDVSGLAVQSASNSKSTAEASVASANAGVAAADAQIASAEATLQAVLDGARVQERAQLQITVDNAQKAFDTAQTNLQRMEALFAEGLISKQELETVQNGFNSAKNGLAQAKESLSLIEEGATASQIKQTEAALAAAQSGKAQAESGQTQANAGINQAAIGIDQAKASQNQAQVVYEQALISQEAAQATLAKTVIKSPMAGVVLNKIIEPGSYIGGGTNVITIGDTSQLKVMLPVPDSEIAEWSVGDTVSLSLYGGAKEGKVSMIAPQTNSGTGTVNVEVVVPNADSEWLAGQIVSASRVSSDNKGILVPIEAVINNGIESYVFKSVNDEAVKVIVETGTMVNNKIHITKGIKEGDQVVVSGGTLLLDGDPLKTSGGNAK